MILRPALLWARNPVASGRGARYEGDPLHFKDHGLVAAWDSSKPATKAFNANDISGLASIVSGAIDVAQAVGANQPLGVGTQQYGEFVSIQFTAANNDHLFIGTTNLFGAGAWTVVAVQRMRNTVGGQQVIWESRNAGFTGGTLAIITNAPIYRVQDENPGAINHDGGVPTTTAPEVQVWAQPAGGVPTLRVNGTAVALSAGTGGQADPGGAAFYTIGSRTVGLSSDMDWLAEAAFTTQLPVSVEIRISHAYGARAGIAA